MFCDFFFFLAISVGFLHKHKGALETLISVLGPTLAQLGHMKVLNDADREEIQSKSTSNQKNEALLKILNKQGVAAQEKFCQVLQKEDCCLFEDLQKKWKDSREGTMRLTGQPRYSLVNSLFYFCKDQNKYLHSFFMLNCVQYIELLLVLIHRDVIYSSWLLGLSPVIENQ